MQVIIHGPNLIDQSRGQFHIHAANCRDNHREISRNGSEYPWQIDAGTVRDVVLAVYGDQIAEGASFESCAADLHFEPCTAELRR